MSLSNPLNLLLLPAVLYLIYRRLVPSPPQSPSVLPNKYDENTYNWMPARHPDVLCHKKYTPKDLAEFDGKTPGGRICLAILRVGRDGKVTEGLERTVFDVTAGGSFYGPDGVYGNFAGRDASRGMAKQSFDDDMLTAVNQPLDQLKDLTPAEADNMRGWHDHFERKYIICGELVNPTI